MKIADLKVGDRLEDYHRGVVFVIKRIAPCGSSLGRISFPDDAPIEQVWDTLVHEVAAY